MRLEPSNDERELDRLIDRMCDQVASAEEAAELGRRLAADAAAREHYVACLELHARLAWQMAPGKPFSPEELHRFAGEDAERETSHLGFGDVGFGDSEISRFGDLEISRFGELAPSDRRPSYPSHPSHSSYSPRPSYSSYPSLSTLPSPLSPPFVGGPVFSYIAATLILGVMLLSAWAYKITHDYGTSFADNSRRSTTSGSTAPQPPEWVFIGRVTGMNDCRWADPSTATYAGAAVPLGRKYALSSGLMEITYRSGAKVILEGPCRYEVESAAGGFLALGKLTARIEERGEGRGERGRKAEGLAAASTRREQPTMAGTGKASGTRLAANHQITKSPNLQIPSPLSPLPSPLFSVRTPTAVVTDLGTEFGVEVSANGDTLSHVYQGKVELRVVADKRPATAVAGGGAGLAGGTSHTIQLNAGESARAVTGKDHTVSLSRQAVQSDRFTRKMPSPGPIVLFEEDFDSVGEGERVGKCFTQWTYSFGNGRADAVVAETPGAVLLRCDADADSAAIVELSGQPKYNFQAFASRPTRITFNIRGGSGGLRNQEGYPHRKWVAIRDGRGEPKPSPMESPGFYVTLALDGRHPVFERGPEQPGNIVFVDPEGKKTFLASWDWTHYDGDGPQTVIIELTRDSYQVEFGDAGMKDLTGSLGGKLPSAGPAPATAAVYCQGVEAPAGLELDGVRVECLHRNARQSDQDVRKEAVRE